MMKRPAHFGNAPIWHNSLKRIPKRPIFYSDWARAGVNQAKDLLDQKFDFLKYKDFKTCYKVYPTYLRYFGGSRRPGKIKRVSSGPGYDQL